MDLTFGMSGDQSVDMCKHDIGIFPGNCANGLGVGKAQGHKMICSVFCQRAQYTKDLLLVCRNPFLDIKIQLLDRALCTFMRQFIEGTVILETAKDNRASGLRVGLLSQAEKSAIQAHDERLARTRSLRSSDDLQGSRRERPDSNLKTHICVFHVDQAAFPGNIVSPA